MGYKQWSKKETIRCKYELIRHRFSFLSFFPNVSWWTEFCIYMETVGNIPNAQTEDSLVILLLTHVSIGHIGAFELFVY